MVLLCFIYTCRTNEDRIHFRYHVFAVCLLGGIIVDGRHINPEARLALNERWEAKSAFKHFGRVCA